MVKKEEVKLVVYGIVASAYITIFYDLFQEFAKNPVNWEIIKIKVLAGFSSLFVGLGALWYLLKK